MKKAGRIKGLVCILDFLGLIKYKLFFQICTQFPEVWHYNVSYYASNPHPSHTHISYTPTNYRSLFHRLCGDGI